MEHVQFAAVLPRRGARFGEDRREARDEDGVQRRAGEDGDEVAPELGVARRRYHARREGQQLRHRVVEGPGPLLEGRLLRRDARADHPVVLVQADRAVGALDRVERRDEVLHAAWRGRAAESAVGQGPGPGRLLGRERPRLLTIPVREEEEAHQQLEQTQRVLVDERHVVLPAADVTQEARRAQQP